MHNVVDRGVLQEMWEELADEDDIPRSGRYGSFRLQMNVWVCR